MCLLKVGDVEEQTCNILIANRVRYFRRVKWIILKKVYEYS